MLLLVSYQVSVFRISLGNVLVIIFLKIFFVSVITKYQYSNEAGITGQRFSFLNTKLSISTVAVAPPEEQQHFQDPKQF